MLPAPLHSFEPIITLVTNTLRSPHSREAYSRALRRFLAWLGPLPLTRASVMAWRASLCEERASAATINLRLCAVRALVREAAASGYLDEVTAAQITSIPDVPRRGVKFGNWMTREQTIQLLRAPDRTTNIGLRDAILLGLLYGCGLRRSEVIGLSRDQVQVRNGRMVLLDVLGKGEKLRTCIVPLWLESDLRAWIERIGPGPLICRVYSSDRIGDTGIIACAVYQIVDKYATALGLELAPHDLRRSFALQSLEGGANIEAIRQALGHASLDTTTRYVQSALVLKNPACDYLGLGK